MRVLVTGANGFTGQHMMQFLQQKDVEVAGLAREQGGVSFYSADLLDKKSLVDALQAFQPEQIIHLAGVALPGFSDIELMYRINAIGTLNLLDAVVESGLKLAKFITASSAHVYGIVDADPVAETHATLPVSHYGNSKLAMENIARMYMDKIPIIITRSFNYTGSGQSSEYVLAKIIEHFRARRSEITLGNIDVVRDFSYIDDILNCYWGLLNISEAGFTVNLCSGVGYSIRQIIEMLNEIAGYQIKVISSNALLRPQDNPVFIGGHLRLNNLLGKQPFYVGKQMLVKLMNENKPTVYL